MRNEQLFYVRASKFFTFNHVLDSFKYKMITQRFSCFMLLIFFIWCTYIKSSWQVIFKIGFVHNLLKLSILAGLGELDKYSHLAF